ncbi:hypothetical protein CK203_097966 [Vitis vinifera]|uniref:Uncharacterized protein n=1 Tax=Vitis vinifera TaxID=29760 RepID=A0A438CXZ6_VITVI|nr:hypothetical protein CK203_097966 [Vitis vinifera]
MYLVSEWAISLLFRCPSPKGAETIYYVSRALADVETIFKNGANSLSLRSAAQKLRPYFQAHPVIVLTDQPLRSILHKPDLTGRMLQWAIELSEFGIEFQPRLSKKGQVMADFVLEYSRRPNQHHESSEQEWWTLRVDGASRSSGSGVGLLLQSPTGEHLEQAIRLGFSASNNEAEYEAILSGLDLALALSVSKLRIYSDSQLVVRHVQKEYEAKDARMARYLAKKIPLANTIEPNQADDQEWTHDIAEYLRQALYPKILNKRTKSGCKLPVSPRLGGTCTSDPSQALSSLSWAFRAQYVLAELHEGICGNHTRGRSLAHRAHSQGYYWPTMKKDAQHMSKNWDPPSSTSQKKFLLVATDYFSKWVEAEAYASIKDKDVTKFEFLFGTEYPEFILHAALSSKQWAAEATNKTLINALKKRLEQAKGKWWRSYPGVLWAYRTTPGRPTGNTPFRPHIWNGCSHSH